jgi:hypothetical protein
MALFQKALPMLMSKRGKRGRNESVVDFATCVLEEWGEMPLTSTCANGEGDRAVASEQGTGQAAYPG